MSTIVARGSSGGGSTSAVGNITTTGLASEDLSGHRVVAAVTPDLAYAGSNYTDRIPLGITTGSAMVGTAATVLVFGEIVETSWNWDTTLPVFMGPNGTLTQTPPVSGLLAVIGTPISPTRLMVDISEFIILG